MTISTEIREIINYFADKKQYKIELSEDGIYIHTPQFIYIPFKNIKRVEVSESDLTISLHNRVMINFYKSTPTTMTTILELD